MKKLLVILPTLLALMLSGLGVTPVYAAGITVNTNTDEINTNGKCSLREAIINANDDAATYPGCAGGIGIDTITFAGNYTITLGNQLPTITSNIIINGNGATNTIIQANPNPDTATYRIFEVDLGTLTLDKLTVRNGHCIVCNGGGILASYSTLTITNSTISGNISGENGGGIYSAPAGHVTVTNSTISGNTADKSGGGIYRADGDLILTNTTFSGNIANEKGGGIYGRYNTLNVTNSSISGNNSTGGGGGIALDESTGTIISSNISGNTSAGGGGIRGSYSNITLTNSSIIGNSTTGNAGGIYLDDSSASVANSTISENIADTIGGGIYSDIASNLDVTNSTISGNNSAGGGGIYAVNDLTVTNSTISGNNATGDGGGIYNTTYSILTVTNSTISGNSSGYRGGGVYNTNTDMLFANSTLSGNTAAEGGAVYNASSGNTWLANSTISGNEAYDYGGGIYTDGGAWIHNSTIVFNTLIEGTNLGAGGIDGNIALYNSIVAGNTRALTSEYRDCSGTMYLAGVNAFWNTTNCSIDPASPGYSTSFYSLNELGPLQDNGGPTWTHALLSIDGESRAIDAGDNALCASWPINNLDQRGMVRPQGSHCDVGAYETVPTFISTAEQDGWILEASETSGKGGSKNNTASMIYLGDNAANKQYRGILSFDTSSIPEGAVINKVTLKVKKAGVKGGGNPVSIFRGFVIDVKTGEFGVAALELGDFKAAGDRSLGPLKPPLVNGWYSLDLTAAQLQINTAGHTQIRLRFKLDDNNNLVANYLKLYSGNAEPANAPQLMVEYTAP